MNEKDTGYRGIWYMNQPTQDEYAYKYSGGLGTYCSSHSPFAVYRPEVEKTFFCYGGTTQDSHSQLLHMVSFFDHKTGMVPKPTLLLDKKTDDAHDNPVMAMDDQGFVWIFSTSHGTGRESFIHRSKEPYAIDQFDRIAANRRTDGGDPVPITNFSYAQVWHVRGQGFVFFLTRYYDPADRTIFCMTSRDGVIWDCCTRLAMIEKGHYQVSAAGRQRIGSAFNYHPDPKGLNWRTNLYYVESPDFGRTWTTADGASLALPLKDVTNAALVHDYRSQDLKVYLMDICYDKCDRPVILYLTSKGHEPGPKNDPRTWCVARWNGESWNIHPVTTSDSNYDMGSLYIEGDGTWRIIGPTETGPQPGNPGGEMMMWTSGDQGENWRRVKQLTRASQRNHTYARRPVDADSGFYAFWADGHSRHPSESKLYFCDKEGHVFLLPREMKGDMESPQVTSVDGAVKDSVVTEAARRAAEARAGRK